MAQESKVAVVAALLGNLGLATLKGIAAAVTGSASMLAETFHSIADTGNQLLLLVGLRLANRPPDARHPFGHGKNVYFWAFIVSGMLFTLGGALSIWEGVRHVLHPVERQSFAWAYGVLAGGVVFEALSLTVALRSLWRAKGHRGVREYWRQTRNPTIVTVISEDIAALVSLAVAAGGIALAQWTGRALWDAGASMLIGVILIGVAVFLAFENYSLLLGEGAPAEVVRSIGAVVEGERGVRALRNVRTMRLGPRALLVVVSVEFAHESSRGAIEAVVARLHARLAEALKGVTESRLIVIELAVGAPRRALRSLESHAVRRKDGPRSRSVRALLHRTLTAVDGRVGRVRDVLFDDRTWSVVYLVVHTGGWLYGRRVLVVPSALTTGDPPDRSLHARLTHAEVDEGPPLDAHPSVSRMHEARLSEYLAFPWPGYWTGPFRRGEVPAPTISWARRLARILPRRPSPVAGHLRSVHSITGYAIEATDGRIGRVADFFCADDPWTIDTIEVDVGRWWHPHRTRVPTEHVTAIDWLGRSVHVDLSRASLRGAA
jgi:cation diffusion facilitator family transporter